MRKALIVLFTILLLPVVFASTYQGSSLEVNEVLLLDEDDLSLAIELDNQNSFDARDILVNFYLPGERLSATFPDLDRGEKERIIFKLDSSYEETDFPLKVVIENDDLHYEETIMVSRDLVEEEKTIELIEENNNYEETKEGESVWQRFFGFLLGLN
tara:strand:+ start:851 stop:1321 length:471 start_codon:yes stop_codon:yes gene_type:complete